MPLNFKFINRDLELKKLIESFEDIASRKKLKSGFVIQGREGIGKTRLVNEFIARITSEIYRKDTIDIISRIPKFNEKDHIIGSVCEDGNIEDYKAFKKIKEEISKHNNLIDIIKDSGSVLLAAFGINDLIEALKRLLYKLVHRQFVDPEPKKFRQYAKFIERKTRNVPLIISLKCCQWIDTHSLSLIRELLSGDNSFWGMIILEIDDFDQENYSDKVHKNLNHLVAESALKRIILTPLDNSFPSKLLEEEFGKDFLTGEENDILFTLSNGNPGKLVSLVDKFIKDELIFREGNKWRKKDNFVELIKPKFHQLIELICTTYSDRVLNEGELRLIRDMSVLWGISKKDLEHTIVMVKCIMDEAFNIVQNLELGILSNHSFIVSDSEGKRYLLEYLPNKLKSENNVIKHRELNSTNLLEAKEIRIRENGVLVIWNFVDAIRIKNLLSQTNEIHIKKVLDKIRQIARALKELHQNGEVHGFIKPESIFKTKNEQYYLATFDTTLINYLQKEIISENRYCLSPEQLKGEKIDFRSDIYSLGILFYESLLERFPFIGNSKEELLASIKQNVVHFDGTHISYVPEKLQNIIIKCIKYNQDDRYKNLDLFLKDINDFIPTPDPGEIIKKINTLIKENKCEEARKLLAEIDDSIIRKEQEVKINDTCKKPIKQFKYKYAYGVIGIVLVAILIWYFSFRVVVNGIKPYFAVQTAQNGVNESNRAVDPEMLQYLIIDGLAQSSNEKILSFDDFNRLYNDSGSKNTKPEWFLLAEITNRSHEYELKLEVKNFSNSEVVLTYGETFYDPSDLLTKVITKVTDTVLHETNISKVRRSTFTQNWDAFKDFYQGEKYQSKLISDSARTFYNYSISKDSSFVLAKLRLAENYNNSQSLPILNDIKIRLSELGKADSLKAVALEYRLNGNPINAINELKQIISFKPADKQVYFEIAEVYFAIRDIENAEIYYRDALKIDPNFTPAINHLAYCYTHLGEHSKAIDLFRKYVTLDLTANSYDSMGDGYMAAGLTDSAVWAKKEGIRINPTKDYMYSSLAYIYLRAGQFEQADSNILQYQRIDNADPDASSEQISTGYFLSALLNYYKGDFENSLKDCLTALKTFDSKNIALRQNENHWLLTILYLKLRQKDKADKEILEMDSLINYYKISETDYNEILKYRLHIEGVKAAMDGNIRRLRSVVEAFDGPIKWKIKDHTSTFDLAFFNNSFGELYFQLGQPELAKQRFEKALEYNENYARAHYNLSILYEKEGRSEEANKEKEIFNKLWKNDNAPPQLFFNINV